MFQLLVY